MVVPPLEFGGCRHSDLLAAIVSSGLVVAFLSDVESDAAVVTSALAFSVAGAVTMANVLNECVGAQGKDCLGVKSVAFDMVLSLLVMQLMT